MSFSVILWIYTKYASFSTDEKNVLWWWSATVSTFSEVSKFSLEETSKRRHELNNSYEMARLDISKNLHAGK